ncbi:MAG: hypothetical protein LBH94_03470 [Deltaproteobacteria bacterium]|jgi:hypothetical protein|nr:hypothetical protein [Deltaproteobacteria bacterium]
MTKQQPCASKLRLSKLCRWLIILGIAKLALFGAWSVDMPLPQLIFPDKYASSPATGKAGKQSPADAAAGLLSSVLQAGEARLASLFSSRQESAAPRASTAQPAPDRKKPEELKELTAEPLPDRKKPAEPKEYAAQPAPDRISFVERKESTAELQPDRAKPAALEESESAADALPESVAAAKRISSEQTDARLAAKVLNEVAARSAAPLPTMPVVSLPRHKYLRTDAEAAALADTEPPLASGVDADGEAEPSAQTQESAESSSWWSEILTLTRLPVPVLGVRQTAHAAALDMPPPAVRPSSSGASPFAPPEQSQAQPNTPAPGGKDGAPLPLRPRIAPQGGTGAPAPSVGGGAGAAPAPAVKAGISEDAPDRKQQELARREQEVLMLKQQMESRLQEMQSTEKKVQGMLKEAHGMHDQKIRSLISAYTNMKPKQAAQALEALEERLAVRILAGMNPKQAGEVLTYTNPKTVAKLSELMARMQIPGQ